MLGTSKRIPTYVQLTLTSDSEVTCPANSLSAIENTFCVSLDACQRYDNVHIFIIVSLVKLIRC